MDKIIYNSKLLDFEKICAQIAFRYKVQKLINITFQTLGIVAIVLYIWACIVLSADKLNSATIYLLPTLIVSSIAVILSKFLNKISNEQLYKQIDQSANFSDDVLAAGEISKSNLKTDKELFWQSKILNESLVKLKMINWQNVEPVHWPRHSFISLFSLIISLLFIILLYQSHINKSFSNGITPFLHKHIEDVVSTFDEWEKEKPIDISEKEWQKFDELKNTVKNLLDKESVDKKDALLALNKVEDQLKKIKKSLKNEVISEHSNELADALDQVNGLNKAAAALRKKKFKDAANQVEIAKKDLKNKKTDKQLAKNKKMASKKLNTLADKLKKKGKSGLSKNLSEMSDAIKNNNPKKMSNALGKLKNSFRKEALRKNQRRGIGSMLSQLGKKKKDIGSGKMPGQNSMRKGDASGNKKGLMAGKGKGGNPFGKTTDLQSNREELKLSGNISEGQSEITTLKSEQSNANTLSSEKQIEFQQYEELSKQAIEDESIPRVYRETIRRYFERIRPQTDGI